MFTVYHFPRGGNRIAARRYFHNSDALIKAEKAAVLFQENVRDHHWRLCTTLPSERYEARAPETRCCAKIWNSIPCRALKGEDHFSVGFIFIACVSTTWLEEQAQYIAVSDDVQLCGMRWRLKFMHLARKRIRVSLSLR